MKLREYKSEDSKIICSWVKDEKTLFQWSADRIGKFPLLGKELNESYDQANISKDFFPLIAIDENNNVIGHLFIRIPDPKKKEIVRFGFVIIAPELRGSGNGKKMLELALEYAKINLKATKVTLGVF
nr:GNAT family N-acetyltransferase [Treponema sp.]